MNPPPATPLGAGPGADRPLLRAAQTRFGVLTVLGSQVWTAQTPLLGFEELRQFVLLAVDGQQPFIWLQSLDDAQVSFLLAPAASFGLRYSATPAMSGSLEWVMVLLPEQPGEPLRPHRMAPLLLHPASATFLQRIVDESAVEGDGVFRAEAAPAPTVALLQRLVVLQAVPAG